MLATSCVIAVVKSPKDYQAYRISPHDTNRLAIIFDTASANTSLTCCLEIFDVGGKTPPNRHQWAVEMFFVLKGEGIAFCDGKTVRIQAGDSLLVPPTGTHLIQNTGSGRLYTLTIMVPNEDFAELIRSGTPVELDAEDMAVLGRMEDGGVRSEEHHTGGTPPATNERNTPIPPLPPNHALGTPSSPTPNTA